MNKISVAVFLVLLASLAFAGEVKTLNPESLPLPFKNRFSHGKVVPANAEWLYTAGQYGSRCRSACEPGLPGGG